VTLHNAPPTHWQAFAVALIIDAILIFVLVMTLLLIRATARPACTCDRREDA
jgi:hypothetical protein